MLEKLRISFKYLNIFIEKMLKTGKNFGIHNFKNNSDINIISSEKIDLVSKFLEENKGSSIIGTHSGAFHADEVLSCVMLKFTNKFNNPIIIRSRNVEIHKLTNVLVDVGGVYDALNNRYDHHQKEFIEENKIKMSSAGLTYKHFGQEIIINLLREWNQLDRNQNNLDLIYNKLYRNFIMCVDAEDNGINQYPDNIKSKYSNQTTYGHRVSRLNPAWDEENPDQSWQFRQAMDIAEDEFLNQLNSIIRHWIPAYSIVKTSLEKRKEFHPSGCLILLEKCCPWKEHLINLEEEMNIKDQIKLCLYKDTDGGYRIQTIPSSLGSFNFRVGLKEDWRGLKPEDLQTVSNIPDIVFVHNSGFIGGAKSLESAIRMSEISLKDKGIIS